MNRETMLQIAKEHRAIIHDTSYTLAVKPTECLVMFNAEDFERFALRMLEEGERRERSVCAELVEGATAYTQFQTVEHYKIAAVIAAVIRDRSKESS